MSDILSILFTPPFWIGFIVSVFFFKVRRKLRYIQHRKRNLSPQSTVWQYPLKRDQHNTDIRSLQAANLKPCPLLSWQEVKIFYAIENHLKSNQKDHRVMAQVCMGEFIKTPQEYKSSHALFNCKRVDMLIINSKGFPKLAIEYQGEGHYQGNATERDAIKRMACARAGIEFLEILNSQEPEDYIPKIHRILEQ